MDVTLGVSLFLSLLGGTPRTTDGSVPPRKYSDIPRMAYFRAELAIRTDQPYQPLATLIVVRTLWRGSGSRFKQTDPSRVQRVPPIAT